MKQRILSLLLTGAMLLSLCPPGLALELDGMTGGLCPHHTEHTEDCGYREAVEGHPCGHVHDGNCGFEEAQEETPCNMDCAEIGEDGQIVHAEGCAYTPAVEGAPCLHEHDGECGYIPGDPGQPCGYVCRICPVQEMIDALPAPEDITPDNRAGVEAQLEAIGAAWELLEDEEILQLDTTRCEAAQNALAALDGQTGNDLPMPLGNAGDFTVSGDAGYNYDADTKTLRITTSGTYTITGTTTTQDKIVIADTITANITLDNVNIDVNGTADACAFEVAGNAICNLTLTGDNVLKSGENKAGLQVEERDGNKASLTITKESNGSLEAVGGLYGAGIGGSNGGNGGTIIINGGTVIATGNGTQVGGGGAGIGGGSCGAGGAITINDGNVTAQGGEYGAGIGGGSWKDGGSVIIYGGTVSATGGFDGAGIGGGSNGGADGEVTINGGKVDAKGDRGGAGIGGGDKGTGGKITINNGAVTAQGGEYGAGIGGGYEGVGGKITINNGTVAAQGGKWAAGIGGGSNGGAGGEVTINGGKVDAKGGNSGAGIGGGWTGAGGNITISSGTVTATGGTNSAGIGSGEGASSSATGTFSTGADGKAYIIANPRISDKRGQGSWRGLIFEDGNVTVGGDWELSEDLIIKAWHTLTVQKDSTLTIPVNMTVTNEGYNSRIVNYGTINGTLINKSRGVIVNLGMIDGTLTNNSGNTIVNSGTISGTLTNDAGGTIVNSGKINSSFTNNGTTSNSGTISNNPSGNGTIESIDISGIKNIPYLDETGGAKNTSQLPAGTPMLCVQPDMPNAVKTLWPSGWYVVTQDIQLDQRVTIRGDVHLILMDSTTLTASKGINVGDGNSLTIYAQPTGNAMGTLIATATEAGLAGIGGNSNEDGGTITINGGQVTAKGGGTWGYSGGAGIGGGSFGSGGTITINGGMVDATGGVSSAGIGSGDRETGGAIAINGGIVTANGNRNAGIGGDGTTFSTKSDGNAFIVASSISDNDDTTKWSGVIFDGENGKIYGGKEYTLTADAEIPTGKVLEIESGKTLTIPNGKTLTNNGTITNNGTLTINETGKLINNGTIINNSSNQGITGDGTIKGDGSLTGDGAIANTVTVDLPAAPTITTHPVDITVSALQLATFTVAATGNPTPYAYKWQVSENNGSSWTDIDGATSDTYAIASTSGNMSGWLYHCVVSNSEGSTTSNAATLTVNKLKPNPDTPTGLTATYGQKLADVTLPTGWAWDAPNTSVGNVGNNPFSATYNEDNSGNYEEVKQNLTVAVQPAPRTITVKGKADSPTQVTLEDAVIDPNGTGGTVSYGVNTTNTPPIKWQTGKVFNGLTAGTTYYFFAKVEASGNYDAAVSVGAPITTPAKAISGISIANQPSKLSYASGETLDLSGLSVTVHYNDGDSGPLENDRWAADPAAGTVLTVTEHNGKTVTISYYGHSATTTSLTVTKGTQATLTIEGVGDKTYGDGAFTLSASGGSGTGAVTFESSDPSVLEISGNTATIHKAGPVTITATKAADDNYKEAKDTLFLTIGQRPITLTADSFTVVTGAEMPSLAYQITSGSLVGTDHFTTPPTLSVSTANTDTVDVFEITIRDGVLTNGDSYQITYVNGKLTVTDKTPVHLTMTADQPSLSGGGTVTLTISGLPSGGAATVSCDKEGIAITGGGASWNATLPNETAAYTFTADYGGDAQHSSARTTCTVNVTKRTNSDSSSNGSNSTPPTTPYPPTVENSGKGGSITVFPSAPKQGDTVTITPKPDEGYAVDKITITDKKGNPVEVTAKPDGTCTFKQPNGKVTIKVTYKQVEPVKTPWNSPFSDVSEGDWYYEAVRFVHERGLMNGYSDGRFGPNDPLSRAQLAQILFNNEGRPGVNYLLDFSDVAQEAWYTEAIRWATSRGIVGGYGNGKFGPNDPITREQLAVMLWRYSGSPAATNKELHFNDADEISGFALEAMRWAVEKGILNGYGDGRLGPQGQATRAQVAQMLKNFIENRDDNI